ncbi:Transposon, En/Spm-like protein [Quillaja saponaria]|uniref:Transposon, En/Spm-like protein n=1 Tax=Quillaja saponaria TaxID=32244 RepID=A0AAD7M511_QUISA|nr:Transposon, En/Spm-like protein [Quillaja saponaria]
MHIEKNVFDNVFNTVMNMKGKTKDNPNGRMDLQLFCKRPELELTNVNGKLVMPKASYSLSKPQVKDVCQWIKGLRLPDGMMFNLKKKARNKACVEGSICEAYCLEEISNFCAMYFKSNVPTKLNRVPRQDDGGNMDCNGRLSVFCQSGRAFGFHKIRPLTDIQLQSANIYVLLNTIEIEPYVSEFRQILSNEHPNYSEDLIQKLVESKFADWLQQQALDDKITDPRIVDIAFPPMRQVRCFNGYFVNGFKFHTLSYGDDKKSMNSGVRVKGSCYGIDERDFYVTVGLDLDAPRVLVCDDPSEEVDPNEINEARFIVDDDIIEEEYDDILENEDDDEEDNDELEMDGEEIMVRSIHGSGSNASRDPPSMNQTSRTTRKSSQSSRAIPSSSQAGFALPRSSFQAGSALPRSSA